MDNPEIEFFQYLLNRFIELNDIDVLKTSVRDLMDKLDEALTPIGGG